MKRQVVFANRAPSVIASKGKATMFGPALTAPLGLGGLRTKRVRSQSRDGQPSSATYRTEQNGRW